jgi:peroxiredoxin
VHELEALQTIYADVIGLGASLVVISPQQPSYVAAMAEKHKLTFPILWDERGEVATAFGLTFALPDDLREVYRGFGIDLPVNNGDPSWRLPVPARFVIDATGHVRSVQADPDYTHRPEPESSLELLRQTVEGAS